jgi:cyclase
MKLKRIFFILLYADNFFYISRNFRIQRVGNIEWLFEKYKIDEIAFSIDELVILNVSRQINEHNWNDFLNHVKAISSKCFIPIAAGGGIRNKSQIIGLIKSGADKIVINSLLFGNIELIEELSKTFGRTTLVASLDYKKIQDKYLLFSNWGGTPQVNVRDSNLLGLINKNCGELIVNSIDRDGTGFGLDLDILKEIPKSFAIPLIVSGGVSNFKHFLEGLSMPLVSGVGTSELFNFIGPNLLNTRNHLISKGAHLIDWNSA